MQVVLPDVESCAPVELRFERPMDDDAFFEFCAENRKLRIEREASGEIIIMPPAGGETSFRNSDLITQLGVWSKRDGRGRAFDSNTEFFLSSGAAYGPDAAWVHNSRLAQFTKEEKRRFLRLCPEFIVELTSPTDRLSKVQAKMVHWMENGALLGWLIDADERTVYVYRSGRNQERLVDIDHIDGEGPVEGFRLDLTDIWQGL